MYFSDLVRLLEKKEEAKVISRNFKNRFTESI
jgi:hypothetical protein